MARAASRFYKVVTVAPALGGYGVFLDGRALKTPGKLAFITRSEAHARLAAAEWEAQGEEINPQTMPITRLYNVAIERTPQQREAMVAEFKKYGGTDLLCYRAVEPHDIATAFYGGVWFCRSGASRFERRIAGPAGL
jgi:chaperone required for assembly of F1-ATPase